MTVRLTGDKQLDRKFRQLTPSLQRNALRKALRASSTAFVKEARNKLGAVTTKRTGNLRKSLGFIKFDNRPATGEIRALAGARQKAGKYLGYHAHLVEFGHNIVVNGRVVGRVAPHPFFRPAMRSAQPSVLSAQRNKLRIEIPKLAKKL